MNSTARLHPDDLAALVAAIMQLDRSDSPWLSADEAAAYLRCPVSRIRKLTMTRRIPHQRDGSRVLYHRDELDHFVRAGGAITP